MPNQEMTLEAKANYAGDIRDLLAKLEQGEMPTDEQVGMLHLLADQFDAEVDNA